MILGTNIAWAVKGPYIYYVTLIKGEGGKAKLNIA